MSYPWQLKIKNILNRLKSSPPNLELSVSQANNEAVMDDDLAVRAEIDNSNEISLSYEFGSYTNSNYGSNKTHMRSKSHSNQPT